MKGRIQILYPRLQREIEIENKHTGSMVIFVLVSHFSPFIIYNPVNSLFIPTRITKSYCMNLSADIY